MALKELINDFEEVLASYRSCSLNELEDLREVIVDSPDVKQIRIRFAEFMDVGRQNLEVVVNSCLQDQKNKYVSRGLGLVETPYHEVEVVCKNRKDHLHKTPHVLAKGIFPYNLSLDQLSFSKNM